MELKDFWSYVDKTPGFGPRGECWIWTGMIQQGKRGGYGHVLLDGKIRKAHRVSWQLVNGCIPEGFQVLHHCDIRPCVNPDHLFLGTNQDNVDDKIRKGRHLRGEDAAQFSNPTRGEEKWNAKLSDSVVLEMRRLYSSGVSVKDIAIKLSQKRNVVNQVVHGRRWSHLPGSLPLARRTARSFTEEIVFLKRQGITQKEIARRLEFSEAAVSRVVGGLS